MAWLFGTLLVGTVVSMPLLRPVVMRLVSGEAIFRGAVVFSGLVTAYCVVFTFLSAELVLALNGRRVWPFHVTRPDRAATFFLGIFLFSLLLLAPLMYLGSAARRAGSSYASARGLTFRSTARQWSFATNLEPWTLQWQIDLGGGGFIAAATTDHLGQDQHRAYTHRTLGMMPGGCGARGLATNGEKVLRLRSADEPEIVVRGIRFLVPSADAESWRRVLERTADQAPTLLQELLYLSCDGSQTVVVLSATLRSQAALAELEQLLRAVTR